MAIPPNDKNKLRGFFDAAQRQKDIEEHVRAHGEGQRTSMELDAATQRSPAAAERLKKEQQEQRCLEGTQAMVESEIGTIIATLSHLPADQGNRRFVINRKLGYTMGHIIGLECHYATPSEADDGFRLKLSGSDAFILSIVVPDDERMPYMCVYDYTRRLTGRATFEASKITPADWDDLRGTIGACVARMAPHRLDEIAAALHVQPPAPEQSTGLSKSIVLTAPTLPFQSPIQKKKPSPTAQPQPPVKKPWLGWFK